MNPIGISVERADGTYGYAKYYYYSGPTVYIEVTSINSAGSKWRVRGRSSQGDNGVYLEGQGTGTFTFNSNNNMSYIFQIQNGNNDWVNTSNLGAQAENSIINVSFDSSGGGSSGGNTSGGSSGSSAASPCGYLIVNQGEGTILNVKRSWPPERTCHTPLETGEPIYCDGEDTFYFEVGALDGYELNYYDYYGNSAPLNLENFSYYLTDENNPNVIYFQIESYGNATVTSSATKISGSGGSGSGSSGSTQPVYKAYIDNGTSWEPISFGGTSVVRKSGSLNGSESGYYEVYCGFDPDVVLFHRNEYEQEIYALQTAAIFDVMGPCASLSLYSYIYGRDVYIYVYSWGIDGFSVYMCYWDDYGIETPITDEFIFEAIKYT